MQTFFVVLVLVLGFLFGVFLAGLGGAVVFCFGLIFSPHFSLNF